MTIDASRTILFLVIGGGATLLCRFLPFLVFGERRIPGWVSYLSTVLPLAVMCILVMYCVKDISFVSIAGYLPCCISLALIIFLQAWKRNMTLSIICGTACYMILIRML